ncbi:MAG TPA: hypothetical protein VKX17_02485 [Planctomycetota bacterium]|nr:hypothetical protein [Planctomycetota bacterium]
MLEIGVYYNGQKARASDFQTAIELAAYEIVLEDCERIKGRMASVIVGNILECVRVELKHPSIEGLSVVLEGPKELVERVMQEWEVK